MTPLPISDQARTKIAPNEAGILVKSVVVSGLAKDADIRPDDIIPQVNDHKVIDVADFVQTVKTIRAGDVATISSCKGSKHITNRKPVKPRPFR